MTNPDRPDTTADHYRDALAICRATLAGDDRGLMALARTIDVGMTFQALVRLHLMAVLAYTDGDAEQADRFLADGLALMTEQEGRR